MPIFHPLKKTSTVFPGIDTDNVIIIPTLFFFVFFFNVWRLLGNFYQVKWRILLPGS